MPGQTQEVPLVEGARDIMRAHWVTLQVKNCLRDVRPDHHTGLLRLEGDGGWLLSVAPEHASRALLILDAALTALVAHGHHVRFTDADGGDPAGPRRCHLEVVVTGEAFAFSIMERLRQSRHVGRPDEISPRKYDPSGRLTLRVDAVLGYFFREWADTAERRVEDVLGEVVLACEDAATMLRAKRAEDERRRLLEEKPARQADHQAREAHRAALGVLLQQMAGDWYKASTIRSLLVSLGTAVPARDRDARFNGWFAWASAYADEIDPLHEPGAVGGRSSSSPPSHR